LRKTALLTLGGSPCSWRYQLLLLLLYCCFTAALLLLYCYFTTQIMRKAALLMLGGSLLVALFSDPLVDSVSNFSKASGVPAFFVSH
jgi:hypothetical protein